MPLCNIPADAARRWPDNPALIFRDEPISFAQLDGAITALAAGFVGIGLRPGDRIALLLPNSPAFVIAYYAASRAALQVVPCNPMFRPPELAYIWRDASVRTVITVSPLTPLAREAAQDAGALIQLVVAGDSAGIVGDDVRSFDSVLALGSAGLKNGSIALPEPPDDGECAVIMYTSGTTGHPKGAMLSHRNLQANVAQVQDALEFDHRDRFITVLPLFHSFSGTVCMNTALSAGCASVLHESFAPANVLASMERHKVSIYAGVPSMHFALLQQHAAGKADLGSLRLIASGGSPLPADLLHDLEERFGVPVLEGDGPTECSPVTSVNRLEGPRKIGSVGPPLRGVEIQIWDDADQAMPTGELGEIVVRGDNVMLGYLNQPEATAEAMRGGWYHTGDVGRLDEEGFLFIVDRIKDMIITGGLNVYPREVEEVLLQHPAVQDAAVIGMPDALRGEAVTAVIVLKPDCTAAADALRSHCEQRLAKYKTPRKFLIRETLPRTATGKVLKRMLRKELELGYEA
ncbi:MAG: long-chain fatty acid--CoA ligase [Armatimonadetes bacterium]|nr:long-chain fatty acid--CoA ligase [Armatimonadota bacterium]MDE2206253.1 long-chain fatty acid--CoA ligase [Armatimonadota bacterium]